LSCGDSTIKHIYKNCYFYFKKVEKKKLIVLWG